jgi:hypothetical protein
VSGAWALRALRWSFCAFIVFAGAQTFTAALGGRGGVHHLALSGVEIAAVLALLIPRLAVAASLVLCAVFAIAAVLTFADGEAPMRFAYYGATAILLGVAREGSLWPQAVSRARA